MNPIFNESWFKRFNTLMLPLAVVWSITNAGGMFLSGSAIEGYASQQESFFEIFHFGEKFGIASHFGGAIHSKTVTTPTLVPDPHRIKAIYRSATGSFVSISDGQETAIVPLGGVYKKVFRLISLTDTAAVFRGYGNTYRLRLGCRDNLSRQEMIAQPVPDSGEDGAQENEWHSIAYQTIVNQMNNLQNLEKTIDISEARKGTKTVGFRVNAIAAESILGQLGILRGDIIQSVNNQKLESFADALNVYSQLPHLRSVRITVLRNNLPKDIVYEITR